MDLSELLRKRLVERVEPDVKTAESLLKTADDNLVAAEDNLKTGHADWALAIAYNAMLSSGRAFLAFKGYRATSESHHYAVVSFCSALMPGDCGALINAFNRYRVRRHDVVYGESGSVGEDEAKRVITSAREFVGKTKALCRKNK